jgi:hypothetical protein
MVHCETGDMKDQYAFPKICVKLKRTAKEIYSILKTAFVDEVLSHLKTRKWFSSSQNV